jgi:hypothetical protein
MSNMVELKYAEFCSNKWLLKCITTVDGTLLQLENRVPYISSLCSASEGVSSIVRRVLLVCKNIIKYADFSVAYRSVDSESLIFPQPVKPYV